MQRMTIGMIAIAGLAACGQDGKAPPAAPGPKHAIDAGAAAAAPAPSIELTATAERGILTLTWRNAGAAPATIATHVSAGAHDHYDWLTVELADGHGPRRLGFVEDRTKAAIQTATLAPGATTTAAIDLVRWAIRADNGAPLAPGSYRVAVTWDARQATAGAQFLATAATALDITAPGPDGCEREGYRAPAGASLVLLGAQAPGGRALAYAGLYNAGTEAACVDSYVHTHEWQHDWLTVLYADGDKYHHVSRVIELDDARDKSYRVSVLLGPGQAIWHTVDVDAWARRARNGSEPLPAGSLYTQLAYDSSKETRAWAGELLSESFGLTVR